MNTSAFFTILTASLNNEFTIGKTLDSVRSQSFQNLEHIVIDGGSSDNTLDILKEFNGTYNLNWTSQPDNGIAEALNKGLKLARGHYILVIQSDDALLDRYTLANVYSILKTEAFDIYVFPVAWNTPARGRTIKRPIKLLWWHHFRNIFPHQGVFVHRRVFGRIGRFNENFLISMDYDFFYRALLSRHSFKFETMPVSLIGRGGVSSRETYWPYRLKEEFGIQDLNEKNPFWRMAQIIFRTLYFPYKTRLLPKLKCTVFKKR